MLVAATYRGRMADPRLFHFDIPTWGNYGDKALFPVVRDAFRSFVSPASSATDRTLPEAATGLATGASFTSSAALRREVTAGLVERINRTADAVVVGGGGLFLQDTNPNRLSGWQWKIAPEVLGKLEVPLVVYAVGDNRFPGQPDFDELMLDHVRRVQEKSVFFGLRNSGSIRSMAGQLGVAAETLDFQPCPTTLARHLYAPVLGHRPDPWEKVLAIQMLVHPRQIAAGYDAEAVHAGTILAARRLVDAGWTILSTPFHPDDATFSSRLVSEVPEVTEVPLYGPDTGWFAGFELFGSIPYVLGGRGHAQMIPFGVGSIPISLDLHAKLGYFAEDVGHADLVIPVGRGTEAEPAEVVAERITARVEAAYATGPELQADLADAGREFLERTARNHEEIRDRITGSVHGSSLLVPRTRTDVEAEDFHLAALAEAEEHAGDVERSLGRATREVRVEHEAAEAVRSEVDTLRSELAETRLELRRTKAELFGARQGIEALVDRQESLASDVTRLRESAAHKGRDLEELSWG